MRALVVRASNTLSDLGTVQSQRSHTSRWQNTTSRALMTLTWLVRFGHIAAVSVWLGGYGAVLFVLVPLLQRHASEALTQTTLGFVRATAYAGTVALALGVFLITRTRGFAAFGHGEWGGLVLAALVITVALLGIGDAALRPALKRLAATGEPGRARLWATIDLGLLGLAYLLTTRTLYAAL